MQKVFRGPIYSEHILQHYLQSVSFIFNKDHPVLTELVIGPWNWNQVNVDMVSFFSTAR